jgi:hypothetical protein
MSRLLNIPRFLRDSFHLLWTSLTRDGDPALTRDMRIW